MKIEEIIKGIERNFEVDKITYKGLHLWLDIRNRFFYRLSIGRESNLVINTQTYLIIIKSLFYGFFNWFKRYDAWFFSGALNRIKVDGKYYDRLFDYPASKIDKSLMIELPAKSHYPRKSIASKSIVSKSPLILLEKIYGLFILGKPQNLEVFDEIKKKYNIELDPKYAIKKMIAQYAIMKLLLRFKRPKVVFISPSYTAYGYIKAFKERNIKVVELQHGVINSEHFGYNLFTKVSANYFPDFLLTFGDNETKVFSNENEFMSQGKVIPVGSFYLEHIRDAFIPKNEIEKLREDREVTFSVSLQDCEIGMETIDFIIQVAKQMPNALFLLKPRRTTISYYLENYEFPENIHFMDELNVYETILSSDIHLTAYSSCALEAPALGKMNILVNLNNKAKEYFEHILTNPDVSVFVDTTDQLLNVVKSKSRKPSVEIREEYKDVMYPNFKESMDEFIHHLV